ncbi:hypothetical protein LTR94_035606, partial [Friedmanniomyces endolithicus]
RDHQPVADPEGRAKAGIPSAAGKGDRRCAGRVDRSDRRQPPDRFRRRDPEVRAGPRLDRDRCRAVVRYRSDRRQGPRADRP